MASKKYCEYFDVNESYFPCIDESAINAGVALRTSCENLSHNLQKRKSV